MEIIDLYLSFFMEGFFKILIFFDFLFFLIFYFIIFSSFKLLGNVIFEAWLEFFFVEFSIMLGTESEMIISYFYFSLFWFLLFFFVFFYFFSYFFKVFYFVMFFLGLVFYFAVFFKFIKKLGSFSLFVEDLGFFGSMIMFVNEVVVILFRPFVLWMRLFVNLFFGHMMKMVAVYFFLMSWLGWFFLFFILVFELFVIVIQVFVFVYLLSNYLDE